MNDTQIEVSWYDRDRAILLTKINTHRLDGDGVRLMFERTSAFMQNENRIAKAFIVDLRGVRSISGSVGDVGNFVSTRMLAAPNVLVGANSFARRFVGTFQRFMRNEPFLFADSLDDIDDLLAPYLGDKNKE